MWIIAEYMPTTLFSLRMSNATNAAAKTLLLPSPYCIKMTLLDASFRRDGIEATKARFEWIKRLEICIEVPMHAVVNGCFVKIQKLGDGSFGSAFALREYVAYCGNIRIAFSITGLSENERGTLRSLLPQINQLGKRGCFVQMIGPPELHEELDGSFASPISLAGDETLSAILQPLDDMQSGAVFTEVDAFSNIRVTREEIRKSVPTLVPYHRRRTSKGFTHYERTSGR